MPANHAQKRIVGISELLNIESIGSMIFLVVGACMCLLMIVAAISSIHAHSTEDVFATNRRAREARIQEQAQSTDLCGATGTTSGTAQ